MSRTFANSLTDLVRALQGLQPRTEADFFSLVRLLGYNLKAPEPPQTTSKPGVRPSKKARPLPDEPSPMPPEATGKSRKPVPSELTLLTGDQHAPPDWLRTVPHLAEATSSSIKSQIPLEPLFCPVWTRAILNDALSTPGLSGEIDIERIIHKISSAQPITELPRRQVPTLIRGVQALVDCSEAMEPFAADQASLKSAIYSVVGREKTQILSFHGTPLWGVGSGLQDEWQAYDPAPPGTPVLVLTDLGIGNPGFMAERADAWDWLEFADLLRRHGCPLIAFVPYPENRWPGALRAKMNILQWDRFTNSSMVRRCIGRALRVQGG